MSTWFRRHRPFVAVSFSVGSLLVPAAIVYATWGEAILRAGYEGRSIGPVNRLMAFDGNVPFESAYTTVDAKIVTALVCAHGLWGLFALLWFASRTRRPRVAVPVAALVGWLVFETLAPPYLVRAFRLTNYALVRDVDHLPDGGPGWNRHALRGTDEPEQFREEDLNLVFLGDSFTYGFRLKPSQSFPARVGQMLEKRDLGVPVRVANFGWTSSSPLLSARRLEAIGAEYSPDVVLLCVDMTDFGDDIRWSNMLERRGMYALYDRIPLTLKLWELVSPDSLERVVRVTTGAPEERFFVTEAPLEQTREQANVLLGNVARIERWCLEHGARFVLVLLPRCYQYDEREAPESWERERYTVMGPHCLEPFRLFEDHAQTVDYPVFSLLDDFRETEVFPTCYEDDPHWNPQGASIAARGITTRLLPYLRAWLKE